MSTAPLTAAFCVPTLGRSATVAENSDGKEKENIMGKMDIVKSDAREVGKRVAVKKATQGVTKLVARAVSPGEGKKADGVRKNIEEALSSENGQAVMSILLGAIVPVLEDRIPEKHRALANEIAQEARVQGEVKLSESFIDQLATPVFAGLLDGVKGALDGVIAADSGEQTEVRAELPMSKPVSGDEADVSAQKAALSKKRQ